MNETYIRIKDINMTRANVEDSSVTCVCMKHINVKCFEVKDFSLTCVQVKQGIDNFMCKQSQ